MGWDTPDLYNDPEKFGLKLIGSIEWYEAAWEFDLTIVLIDESGQLYYASDSGCSCPSPFENYTNVSDATKVSFTELDAYLKERAESAKDRTEATDLEGKVTRLIELTREAMR